MELDIQGSHTDEGSTRASDENIQAKDQAQPSTTPLEDMTPSNNDELINDAEVMNERAHQDDLLIQSSLSPLEVGDNMEEDLQPIISA